MPHAYVRFVMQVLFCEKSIIKNEMKFFGHSSNIQSMQSLLIKYGCKQDYSRQVQFTLMNVKRISNQTSKFGYLLSMRIFNKLT